MIQEEISGLSTESLPGSNSLETISSGSHNLVPTTSVYDGLVLTGMLNKAKFPVMAGTIPSSQESLAVKLFPFQGDNIHRNYANEILFANLRHKNITSVLHYEHETELTFEGCSEKVSYIIMELAPYGDFCDLIISGKIQIDDKLARTYFHQAVEGVEYLHSAGVAHLDLKLENLLIGKNFNLQICDFDQAYLKGQNQILSRGTINFRALELFKRQCQNPEAADVYSLGVILFALKCGGVLPYSETDKYKGVSLFGLLKGRPELFWKQHCQIQNKESSFFDDDFKTLFESMMSCDPDKRANIEQIKNSTWYTGPVHTEETLKMVMESFI